MKSQGKLENRLLLMKPVENGIGKFIPYCNYQHHKGVVIHNNYKLCERRKCTHYLRLYIVYKDLNNQKNSKNNG